MILDNMNFYASQDYPACVGGMAPQVHYTCISIHSPSRLRVSAGRTGGVCSFYAQLKSRITAAPASEKQAGVGNTHF